MNTIEHYIGAEEEDDTVVMGQNNTTDHTIG